MQAGVQEAQAQAAEVLAELAEGAGVPGCWSNPADPQGLQLSPCSARERTLLLASLELDFRLTFDL